MAVKESRITHLDCTLRDGGYYNNWDFPMELIQKYIQAMSSCGVNVLELGFRSLYTESFRGACAFTTDAFINGLELPDTLTYAVMINANEFIKKNAIQYSGLETIFPENKTKSKVSVVRVAVHSHEFNTALPISNWLHDRGFQVCFNIMQIADRTHNEIVELGRQANEGKIKILYFADSMGSMTPTQTENIVHSLANGWKGELGVHTHDNLGFALQNSMRAIDAGVTWIDSTVTGMGRGPGNAKTEQLALELAERRSAKIDLIPIARIIRDFFGPEQARCGWGTNLYYYLSGKYGIHPSYVQEMLNDSRYEESDIFSVINYLKEAGGKKFNIDDLDLGKQFYADPPKGTWNPSEFFQGKDVLLLGSGLGAKQHRKAIESYVQRCKPIVMALNTQPSIDPQFINIRVACHPTRLLADQEDYKKIPQPLVMPMSMLPEEIQNALREKDVFDFGINVRSDHFEFNETFATVPAPLVIAYALAVATSGKANRIFMAGFDGYAAGDPRNKEIQHILTTYAASQGALDLISITNTTFELKVKSVYSI